MVEIQSNLSDRGQCIGREGRGCEGPANDRQLAAADVHGSTGRG